MSRNHLRLVATSRPPSRSLWRRLRGPLILALVIAAAAGLAYGVGLANPGSASLPWEAAALAAPALSASYPQRALTGGGPWLNSRPLRAEDLRGKVVLVNFWTYTCINSLRPLPYVRAWAEKYRDRGLVVIGVHTPEFGFEKDLGNVRRAVAEQNVGYPVVLDSDYRVWNAFENNAWPAFYFIGADGRIRRQVLGEGRYDQSERLIQTLLAEARRAPVHDAIVPVDGKGAQAAPDWAHLGSEETYVGFAKAQGFASEGSLQRGVAAVYRPLPRMALNRWSLSGRWQVGDDAAALAAAPGLIAYRFHARDLNLVLAPPADGRAVRFRVRLDGEAPGSDHGTDTDAQGWGEVREPRMYQLVRQSRRVADRTFEVEFFDPGVRAFVFTFG